jgi:hypothetical protein
VLKTAWMKNESLTRIKVLRNCFLKLSNAVGHVNSTFDNFWLLDTLHLTVATVSTLSRIAQNPEKSFTQIIVATISIMRLLLLAIFCGDASDQVSLQI